MQSDSARNHQRTVLVTGVNNPEGIGVAIARTFAANGDALMLTGRPVSGRREYENLPPGEDRYAALRTVPVESTADELRRPEVPVRAMAADLTDPEAIPPLFREAEAHLGPVAVLVHNAAHCSPDSFRAGNDVEFVSAESHDRHFAVNSRATALLMTEFVRRYREHGLDAGRIINVSTDAAAGHAGQASYGASKNALESYSRAGARELGPRNITVNVVAPGPVQTGWIDSELEEELLARLPAGRLGAPEDIAAACLFLASRRAGWITGEVFRVNGGGLAT